MRRVELSLAALAVLGASTCVFVDIDYAGKTCPCPEPEYHCDASTNTCAEGPPGADDCTPTAVPSRFRNRWQTPNTLYWEWDPPENLDAVSSYRVVIGKSADAVESESDVVVFTPAENAELGERVLIGSSNTDPVRATVTDGLEPDTTYYARLVTVDNAGCEDRSAIVSEKTTRAHRRQVTLFAETPRPGSQLLPEESMGYGACPGSGASCFFYQSPVDDWENVRMKLSPGVLPEDELQSPPQMMTAGELGSTAYYEITIGTDSATGPTWSEPRLFTALDLFVVGGFVLRTDGVMHTYQIPLREMGLFVGDTGMSRDMTFEDLEGGVTEIGVGSDWTSGARVWIESAYLRW